MISRPWQQTIVEPDQQQLDNIVRCLSEPVLLTSNSDDSLGNDHRYRYTLLSGDPIAQTRANSGQNNAASVQQAFEQLRELKQSIPAPFNRLPFCCGLIGYLDYDFGEALILGANTARKDTPRNKQLPIAFAAYYTWSYVYDHHLKKGYLTFSPLCEDALRDKLRALFGLDSLSENNTAPGSVRVDAWTTSQTYQQYESQFKTIKEYIAAGDCYQANLTQRFESNISGDGLTYFRQLNNTIANPYSGYISLGPKQQLLCFSPEQFIAIKHRRVLTRPIKGTTDRLKGEQHAQKVLAGDKNRAENLMIVDLMRNDLSKSCRTNSVKVSELFQVERFANVYHLTSTIEGTLQDDMSELSVLFSCFPGGSITGAPKKRAMEIIAEQELYSRRAYCGSMFYLSDDGQMDSNIMIRTVIRDGDTLYCWGGGGIVADSELNEEYEESLTKVNNITGIIK